MWKKSSNRSAGSVTSQPYYDKAIKKKVNRKVTLPNILILKKLLDILLINKVVQLRNMYSSFALNNKHSLLIHLISWAEPTSSVLIFFFDFLINKNLKNEGWAKFTLIQNCATNVQSESSCSLLFTVYCSKLPNLHNFKKNRSLSKFGVEI